MTRRQRTVRHPVRLEGVGLHSGEPASVEVRPAPAEHGVVFVREDLPDAPVVPATLDYLAKGERRTVLRNGEAQVDTVEHLLAAFAGLGIDNAEVRLSGPEIPGLDGSAAPIVERLNEAGVVEQKADRAVLRLEEPIHVREGDASIFALPHDEEGLRVQYTLDLSGTTFGAQFVDLRLGGDAFPREVAPARTFVRREEVERAREAGLGRGADTTNTLVIDDGQVLDNELRFPDEFARHKVLDLLGDLFLVGADVWACIVATRSGHRANWELARRLRQEVERREVAGELARESGMDIRQILDLLPHRYPFLLIDRVIELEGYRRAVGIKNVTVNEPFFQGHWPGQPIMPGVLILEAMAQLAGVLLLRRLENTGKLAVLWSIDKVKLRRSVIPGDQLRIEIEATKVRDTIGQVQARAKVGEKIAAEAVLTFTLVDAQGG